MVIQRSVSDKRWSVVDFQHVRLAVLVEHNVDAQDVKAHVPHLIVRLAEAILMCDERMPK